MHTQIRCCLWALSLLCVWVCAHQAFSNLNQPSQKWLVDVFSKYLGFWFCYTTLSMYIYLVPLNGTVKQRQSLCILRLKTLNKNFFHEKHNFIDHQYNFSLSANNNSSDVGSNNTAIKTHAQRKKNGFRNWPVKRKCAHSLSVCLCCSIDCYIFTKNFHKTRNRALDRSIDKRTGCERLRQQKHL